jgi:hypothetical protein
MFEGWSFLTVDTSDTVRVKHRQVMEAEFASMGQVWRDQEKHFWAWVLV